MLGIVYQSGNRASVNAKNEAIRAIDIATVAAATRAAHVTTVRLEGADLSAELLKLALVTQ